MSSASPELYAQWRAQEEARFLLRERDAPQPPERLLQSIWRHQRLRRDLLRTLDGEPVRVLHPGFWNREAGCCLKALRIADYTASNLSVDIPR